MYERIEAINLKTMPYKESSRIVFLFTREYGKLNCMVRGVQRSRQGVSGKLQTFMHNYYMIRSKSDLPLVTLIDNQNPFLYLTQTMDRLDLAYRCLQIISPIIQPRHQDENLFDLLLNTLTQLNDPEENPGKHFTAFKQLLLHIEGVSENTDNESRLDYLIEQYIGHPIKTYIQ